MRKATTRLAAVALATLAAMGVGLVWVATSDGTPLAKAVLWVGGTMGAVVILMALVAVAAIWAADGE